LVNVAPLRWWLRDSVSRASFRLVAAYLARDRDVKLRVYPGIAPMLVLPVIFLMPGFTRSGTEGGGGSSGLAFSGAYLMLMPMMTMGMLEMSQHWQAADVFRLAPVSGPAAITHGMRRAVLTLLAFPMLVVYVALTLMFASATDLVMLLPTLIALPVFAMIPCLGGQVIPFSRSPDNFKATMRMFYLVGSMITAGIVGTLALAARERGWLVEFLIAELLIATTAYVAMRASIDRRRWASLE
jgi:hypothetical protein